MNSCCINDLGQKPHNENIDLGIQAEQAGIFIAILFFAGMRINRPFTLAIGDDIIVPRPFNETYLYKMQIKQPDGTLLVVDDCDTFSFQTFINVTPGCGECDCTDTEEGAYS